MQFAEYSNDIAIQLNQRRSARMEVWSDGPGRFEVGRLRNPEGTKIRLDDTFDSPEAGLDRGLPDGAQGIVAVADRGDSLGLCGYAAVHPEDLAELESVKGGRFAVEVE